LPPVSTTPAELVAKFAAGVVDTSGKFDLRISPQIYFKIQNDRSVIFRGLAEDDS
jgi:hypothetical protein